LRLALHRPLAIGQHPAAPPQASGPQRASDQKRSAHMFRATNALALRRSSTLACGLLGYRCKGGHVKEFQLIYGSTPFGFDDLALVGILSKARFCNKRDDITGSLVCREDLYLQLLEGAKAAVQATFERIRGDDRHSGVVILWSGEIEARLFPDWTMRHDHAQSWMWTRDDVAKGAFARATDKEVRAVFAQLATAPPLRN